MGRIRQLSVKLQFALLACVTLLVIVFIAVIVNLRTSNIFSQKNDLYSRSFMNQIKNTISSNCEFYNNMLQNIAYNRDVQRYLTDTDKNEQYEAYRSVSVFVNNFSNMKSGILDIVILGETGTSYSIYGNTNVTRQLREQIPMRVGAYYTGVEEIVVNLQKISCLAVGTQIIRIYESMDINRVLGVVVVFFDINELTGIDAHYAAGTQFVLLDRNDRVFSASDLNLAENIIREGVDLSPGTREAVSVGGELCNIAVEPIPELSGKIVGVTPVAGLLEDINRVTQTQIILLIISVGILFIPFALIIHNILSPMNALARFMRDISWDTFKESLQLQGCSEIMMLTDNFNDMLAEISRLTRRLVETNTRLYEQELANKQADLNYLRSQINPHFLYNTLELIRSIASIRKVYEVRDMTKSLGDIMRYSIRGENRVRMRDEIKVIKSYTGIQQMRFPDKYTVIFDIPEQLYECVIIKMILQPLVENAFQHGLEPKAGEGSLRVAGALLPDGSIALTVEDDGVGMDEETFERLKSQLRGRSLTEQVKTDHIGLLNVSNRVWMTYGEEYGISLNRAEPAGIRICISIPCQMQL
jgi:two-component system sensor histidine kinase YesM